MGTMHQSVNDDGTLLHIEKKCEAHFRQEMRVNNEIE